MPVEAKVVKVRMRGQLRMKTVKRQPVHRNNQKKPRHKNKTSRKTRKELEKKKVNKELRRRNLERSALLPEKLCE
jgi:hypothetical protein